MDTHHWRKRSCAGDEAEDVRLQQRHDEKYNLRRTRKVLPPFPFHQVNHSLTNGPLSSTHTSLYAQTIEVPDFRPVWEGVPIAQQFGSINPLANDGKGDVKLWMMHRYRMKPVPCVVDANGYVFSCCDHYFFSSSTNTRHRSTLKINCQDPQHAVTPGQVAVLYGSSPSLEDGNGEMWCLGSGIISSASAEA